MDFITLESLGTVGGATAAVTSMTQILKMVFKHFRYKTNPKTIAFVLSLVVASVVLSTQEITFAAVFLAAINSLVVWLAAIGTFEACKEVGEHFYRKDDEQ